MVARIFSCIVVVTMSFSLGHLIFIENYVAATWCVVAIATFCIMDKSNNNLYATIQLNDKLVKINKELLSEVNKRNRINEFYKDN